MSEKQETKRRQHAAVLRIYPSGVAIEWLKAKCPDGWRDFAAGTLSEHLEFLADGDRFARIHAGALEELGAAEIQAVLAEAETAGLIKARGLRAEKRREALLSGYTAEELEAALAEAQTWTGAPTGGDEDRDDYSLPVPPKKGASDGA